MSKLNNVRLILGQSEKNSAWRLKSVAEGSMPVFVVPLNTPCIAYRLDALLVTHLMTSKH